MGNLRIKYLGIKDVEVSTEPLILAGRSCHSMTYTDALDMGLIKGNKNGWRIPSISEWKFLFPLEKLGIISFPSYYYLTSDIDPEYIPKKIRDSDPEIQEMIEEDPYYLEESGIAVVYIWDTQMEDEWGGEYDGNSYGYILIRDL